MPRKSQHQIESRVGTGGASKARFPNEGGGGEKYLSFTNRCQKQDAERPALRCGFRCPGNAWITIKGKKRCAEGGYYEYRRNRCDRSSYKQYRKQHTHKSYKRKK